MKNKIILLFLLLIFMPIVNSQGQDIYRISGGEMIFSWADMQISDDYRASFPLARVSNTPARFTLFLHLGQYLHMDFNNNIGIFTGTTLRNVGFISNEVLPDVLNPVNEDDYENYKIVRRSYTFGVPLALKIGSFKDHLFFFGGAEIEWAFVSKTKWWNSHSRSGPKTKKVTWFPNDISQLQPSFFAGVQLPGGMSIKYRVYINDFINSNNRGNIDPLSISGLGRYSGIHMMHISFSWQYRHTGNKLSDFNEYASSSY